MKQNSKHTKTGNLMHTMYVSDYASPILVLNKTQSVVPRFGQLTF